jgi:hypothetical protein
MIQNRKQFLRPPRQRIEVFEWQPNRIRKHLRAGCSYTIIGEPGDQAAGDLVLFPGARIVSVHQNIGVDELSAYGFRRESK